MGLIASTTDCWAGTALRRGSKGTSVVAQKAVSVGGRGNGARKAGKAVAGSITNVGEGTGSEQGES